MPVTPNPAASPIGIPQTMAANVLRQSAYAASGLEQAERAQVQDEAPITRRTTASRSCTPASRRANSATPRVRPAKHLPAHLLAALNEPVVVTIDGRRRKITKRQAVVAQLATNRPAPICARPRC